MQACLRVLSKCSGAQGLRIHVFLPNSSNWHLNDESSKNYKDNRETCLLASHRLHEAMTAFTIEFPVSSMARLLSSSSPNASHTRIPSGSVSLFSFYGKKLPLSDSPTLLPSPLVLSGHLYSVLLFLLNNNELSFIGP